MSREGVSPRTDLQRTQRWRSQHEDFLALTLWQPWAWLVTNGDKDIENRSWRIRAGLYLVHTSATCPNHRYEHVLEHCRWHALAGSAGQAVGPLLPPRGELVLGAITGWMVVGDEVLEKTWSPVRPWHFAGQLGHVLTARGAFERPIACKGMQKAWRLPKTLAPAVREQLPEAAWQAFSR